ncbi:Cysteine-rich repeat secretory protein 55 [Apostasia shenzhenica]|uniref:Cysteine-rich repeat secretory protein 55 n=1 Tax=Apostasia shenzhenica TaxID=1088818 RepID=A0A2I0ALM6_9ASPA|nr:Cysteine-rich repeat secretory protein 55 [Apostasia shenzhenica]
MRTHRELTADWPTVVGMIACLSCPPCGCMRLAGSLEYSQLRGYAWLPASAFALVAACRVSGHAHRRLPSPLLTAASATSRAGSRHRDYLQWCVRLPAGRHPRGCARLHAQAAARLSQFVGEHVCNGGQLPVVSLSQQRTTQSGRLAWLFFLLLLALLLIPLASCADPINLSCGQNFTGSGELLQGSLDRVLPDLVVRTPADGFAVSTYGSGNYTVYGLTRCRGDLTAAACSFCIAEAARKLPEACAAASGGHIWYEECFLRYDTEDFLGTLDMTNGVVLINTANATDPFEFDSKVEELMAGVWKAAVVPGQKRFARGLSLFPAANLTIEGMAQCTRDLTVATCEECLVAAVGLLPNYCRFRQGCRILYGSCVVRYEIYEFLFAGNWDKYAAASSYKVIIS